MSGKDVVNKNRISQYTVENQRVIKKPPKITSVVKVVVSWNIKRYELLFEYFAHFFGKSLVAVARKIRFRLLVF